MFLLGQGLNTNPLPPANNTTLPAWLRVADNFEFPMMPSPFSSRSAVLYCTTLRWAHAWWTHNAGSELRQRRGSICLGMLGVHVSARHMVTLCWLLNSHCSASGRNNESTTVRLLSRGQKCVFSRSVPWQDPKCTNPSPIHHQ